MTDAVAPILNPPNTSTGERAAWACRALLVALVVVTFGRLIKFNYAQWDDAETIFANPLHHPVSVDSFIAAWTTPQMVIYIPLTHTMWAILAAIGAQGSGEGGYEISSVPFRIVSLLLHAGSTLLVFEILRRAITVLPAALLGAAIFAVHPIQVEAVAWISGQKDLLAGFCAFAAAFMAIRAADRTRSSAWTYGTWLLGTLAMLSKPQAVVTPLLIAVLLRLVLCVSWRRTWALTCPLLLPAVVMAIIARTVQPSSMVPETPLLLRPVVALDSIAWYTGKLLLPIDLTIDYGHTPRVALAAASTYLGAAAVALAIVVAWWLRRRQPLLVAGLAIAVIGPLPVLGLTRFDFQYHSTVADHYLYTGMLGVALALAALYRLVQPRWIRAAFYIVLLPLAVLAWRQAGLWRDTETLFGHNLAVTPKGLAPNRVLGFVAAQRGDDETAVEFLKVALERYPRDAIANYNLGNALVRLGSIDAAAAAFQIAIEANHRKAEYRHNYAVLLIRQGKLDEAERQLELALQADPRAEASRQALAKLRAMRPQPAS